MGQQDKTKADLHNANTAIGAERRTGDQTGGHPRRNSKKKEGEPGRSQADATGGSKAAGNIK